MNTTTGCIYVHALYALWTFTLTLVETKHLIFVMIQKNICVDIIPRKQIRALGDTRLNKARTPKNIGFYTRYDRVGCRQHMCTIPVDVNTTNRILGFPKNTNLWHLIT